MFSLSRTVNVPIRSGDAPNRSVTRSISSRMSPRAVGVGVVVGVAGIQHRVEQLFLRLEVMQQARRADPGFLGDLPERGIPPAVPRQQPLGDGQNPLLAVLALGEQRGVWPLIRHPVPPTNLLNVH